MICRDSLTVSHPRASKSFIGPAQCRRCSWRRKWGRPMIALRKKSVKLFSLRTLLSGLFCIVPVGPSLACQSTSYQHNMMAGGMHQHLIISSPMKQFLSQCGGSFVSCWICHSASIEADTVCVRGLPRIHGIKWTGTLCIGE